MSSPPSVSPSSSDLPPKRKGKAIRHDVSKPLENTRLSQLINILIAVSVLMTAVYTYRLIQYKNHVGGWSNLALGRFPERPQGVQFQNIPGGGREKGSLESHITALADILDMRPTDLASVLSQAVREHVAPKSISSLSSSFSSSASAAGAQGTFTDVLFSNDNKESNSKGGSEEGIFGKAGTIAKAVWFTWHIINERWFKLIFSLFCLYFFQVMGADHEPELVG